MTKEIKVSANTAFHETNNKKIQIWEKAKSIEYHEYRKKWVKNPENFIVEQGPLHLDIDITSICNLRCPMCYRTVLLKNEDNKNNFEIGSMKLDTYKKIIDEASQIGVYSVKLQWLGEPLIHPNVEDMIKYAKDKGIVDVMLNTNAVLLTPEKSRKIINAELDKIFFSFDSINKEKYEKIRVGANFDKTLNNIKTFSAIRDEMKTISPLTRVSMVLMDENKDEYEDFYEMFKDIVDVVAYGEYINPYKIDKTDLMKDNNFICSELWQRMVISWNGDCLVCCGDSQKKYIVGNINEDSIREIWKNDKYKRIREYHKAQKWFESKLCIECDLPYKGKK